MKNLWIIALLSAMIMPWANYAQADRHEKMVNKEDLPQSIQQFIDTHFAGITVSTACVMEKGKHKVELSDGYEVEFDHNGNWEEIDNELHAALPASVISLLPTAAVNYIAQNYPNQAVYSIERDNRGYEVKIHSAAIEKLYFDRNGNLVHHKTEK